MGRQVRGVGTMNPFAFDLTVCLACNALVCILMLYLVCKSKDDR